MAYIGVCVCVGEHGKMMIGRGCSVKLVIGAAALRGYCDHDSKILEEFAFGKGFNSELDSDVNRCFMLSDSHCDEQAAPSKWHLG